MKKFTLIILVLIGSIMVFSACKPKQKSSRQDNKSLKKKQIVLPEHYFCSQGTDTSASRQTLFVVIDAHADGKMAVDSFQLVTEKYNCTVIGLTDVHNDEENFIQKIDNDIKSAEKNLHLDVKHLFIGGFSGGARMALAYAMNTFRKIDGVMMCGAGFEQQNLPDFPVAMIIGNRDFNFVEQYYSPYSKFVDYQHILTLVFDGIHQWPSKKLILDATSYLFAQNGLADANSAAKDFLRKALIFEKKNEKFEAFKMFEAAYKTADDKNYYKNKLQNYLHSSAFKQYMKNFEQILKNEMQRNNEYINDLQTKDISWWQNEIAIIVKKMKQKDKLKADSYARTKAFLGIAMYSLCNREIKNKYSTYIDKYLKIYELLEPENKDMKRFKQMRKNM